MIRFSACFERLIGFRRQHQGIKTTLYFILFLRRQVPHSFYNFFDRGHLVLPSKPNCSQFILSFRSQFTNSSASWASASPVQLLTVFEIQDDSSLLAKYFLNNLADSS